MRKTIKILLITVGHKVGDSVIDTFFIRELKKVYPQSLITLMTTAPKLIFDNNPHINDIIIVPLYKNRWLSSIKNLIYLRKQEYDILIFYNNTLKRKLFSYLIGAKENIFIKHFNNTHISYAFVDVLKRLGLQNIDTHYELFISQEDESFAKNFITSNSLINKSFLVFNPKGSTSTRSLSKENIKKILMYLKKHEYSIVLLDYEKEYMDFEDLVLLCTSNNIMQVAALIEKSDYVLTTDTGIVHIADVYSKPMTVLYSDVFKEGEEPRNDSYIAEWKSINPKTKMLRDKYNVNNINLNSIFDILDKELLKNE